MLALNEFEEAQSMELGKHDNVVRVYSAEVEQGVPVIRMEYLEDGSVAGKYGRDALPVRDALRIMEAACRGAAHIHSVGLLHRDIKPANLLLHPLHIAKVSDFGLACGVLDVADATAMSYLAHLPPESVADGTRMITSVAGDVYALALTTFRLLNGDRKVRSRIESRSWVADDNDWQPYIHKTLRAAVAKGMHPNPEKRTSTAQRFRYSLEQARPAVSWEQVASVAPNPNGLFTWRGSAIDGTDWRARINLNSAGQAEFTSERQCPVGWWTSDRRGVTRSDQRVVLKVRRFGVVRLPVSRLSAWRR